MSRLTEQEFFRTWKLAKQDKDTAGLQRAQKQLLEWLRASLGQKVSVMHAEVEAVLTQTEMPLPLVWQACSRQTEELIGQLFSCGQIRRRSSDCGEVFLTVLTEAGGLYRLWLNSLGDIETAA